MMTAIDNTDYQRVGLNSLDDYFDSRVRTNKLPKYILDQLQTPSGSWKYDYTGYYSIFRSFEDYKNGIGNGYIQFNPDCLYTDNLEAIVKTGVIFSYTKNGNRWKFKLEYSCYDHLKSRIVSIVLRETYNSSKIEGFEIKPNHRAMLLKWAYADPGRTSFHGKTK